METFVWDQNFATDLPEVDRQHQELIDLFNQLNRSLFLADNSREPVLQETFAGLVAYASSHFRHEEELMRSEGLDPRYIAAHRKEHEQFARQVTSMWRMRAQLQDPAETFIGFLTSWLGLHILGVDQSMARQIRQIQQGVPAAQAFAQEMSIHDNASQALLKMIHKLYQVLSEQNSALAQANQLLEERVTQRTQELTLANAELQRANQQLEIYSRTDGLLQIANRAYFDEHLASACASAFRRQQPIGLLMIDVDCFKRYNDRYGHQAGDACLMAVAQAVSHAMLRSTDLVSRYGGEELAVILPDTGEAGTRAVAERIVAAIAALGLPHETSTAAAHVTVSAGGISRIPTAGDSGPLLLTAADAALYRAKAAGRNRWVLAPAPDRPATAPA